MNVLAEYWYLWILLVILAVAAFFAWSKAAQAARKRGEKRAEIEEKLKYEIAGELGLLDQVLENGWKSLSAKETGRIGGLMTRRKKQEK